MVKAAGALALLLAAAAGPGRAQVFQPAVPARAEEVKVEWVPAAPQARPETPRWHAAPPSPAAPAAAPAQPMPVSLPPPPPSLPPAALAAPLTKPAAAPAAPRGMLPPPASPAAPAARVQTVAQQPPPVGAGPAEAEQPLPALESSGFVVPELPGPQQIFRLDSETTLQERIRQEKRKTTPVDKVEFPEEPVLSRSPYYGRRWPAQKECAEPNYVCYGRLLFEQKNLERYGWDLGAVTPFVSALAFYGDVVTLPYHEFTDPCRCFECSAGYCLPGDPVPFLLYPVEPSVTGALAEAASVAAVLAIFP